VGRTVIFLTSFSFNIITKFWIAGRDLKAIDERMEDQRKEEDQKRRRIIRLGGKRVRPLGGGRMIRIGAAPTVPANLPVILLWNCRICRAQRNRGKFAGVWTGGDQAWILRHYQTDHFWWLESGMDIAER
jgi:hypothetical protein